MKLKSFNIILIFFSLNIHANDEKPTTKQVIEWGKNCPTEHLEHIKNSQGIDINIYKEYSIDRDLHKVGTLNKDTAFLVEVSLKNAGRNFFRQILLIRPNIKTACILGYPITHGFKVYDFDDNGVSEIATVTYGSGQGATFGKKSIIQLDGWKPIILRQMAFQDTIGASQIRPGTKINITWDFKDIDGDGMLDLDETRKVTEERFGRNNIITNGLYRYVFKENSFIRYLEYKRKSKAKIK